MPIDTRSLTSALLLGLAACVPGREAADAAATVRDSTLSSPAGPVDISIIENPPAPPALPTWRLAAEPQVELGSAAGAASEAASLFRVAGAVRLSDGRIVVADGGSRTLKVFGVDGEYLAAYGGPGAGPGEFGGIQSFAGMRGDSLMVFDLRLGRLSIFDSAGRLAREARVGATPESPRSYVSDVFGDGSLLGRGFLDLGGRVPSGVARHAVELYHLTADGMLADSLGAVTTGESFYVPLNGGFSVDTPPFGRSTVIEAAGDRLYIADSGEAEIRVSAPDGTPIHWIRWAAQRAPVDPAMVEAARDHGVGNAGNDNQRRMVERMFAEAPMPERVPAFSEIVIDDEGNVWVRSWSPPWLTGVAEWRVFDREGRLSAMLSAPGGLRPTHIGADFILGIARDELDVEHVRLYRLERAALPR